MTGTGLKGGFTGSNQAAWSAAFWDLTTTGLASASPSGAVTGVTGETTENMKRIATFQDAGWSISSSWSPSGSTWGMCSLVNDGYPYLQAFYTADPCAIEDPSQYPTASPQEFSVNVGTTSEQCGALAPSTVDWPALKSLRGAGWSISYADWPNDRRGGWVCSRQPYYDATGWHVR